MITRWTGLIGGAVVGSAALASAAPMDEDRALLARAAADRPSAQASAGPAGSAATAAATDDLSQEEQRARIDATMAQMRLELVLARKALRSNDLPAAARHALRVQELRRELPASVDLSEAELMAEGILARAAKAGVDLSATLSTDGPPEPSGGRLLEDYLDRQVDAALHHAGRYDGPPRDTIDPALDAATLRQQTLANQVPDESGYRPGRELIDAATESERDQQRLWYDSVLDMAVKADEARLSTDALQARLAPGREVAYPADWPERVARRSAYQGGLIARSAAWTDPGGREWYAGVYDIHDLIYSAPDFASPLTGHPAEDLRNALDRDALRRNSEIFNGTAADLAAGLPLLHYFGGVDAEVLRGPRYDVQRQKEIVELIRAFTTQRTEPLIVPLQP